MSPDSSETFDGEAYAQRKRRERLFGWIFSLLGGLVLLDSGSPVPVPLVGLPSLLIGGAMIAFGVQQLRAFAQMPLREALLLGRSLGGRLTRTDLFLHLGLDPERTDQLLQVLISQGFIEPESDDLPMEQEMRYRLLS